MLLHIFKRLYGLGPITPMRTIISACCSFPPAGAPMRSLSSKSFCDTTPIMPRPMMRLALCFMSLEDSPKRSPSSPRLCGLSPIWRAYAIIWNLHAVRQALRDKGFSNPATVTNALSQSERVFSFSHPLHGAGIVGPMKFQLVSHRARKSVQVREKRGLGDIHAIQLAHAFDSNLVRGKNELDQCVLRVRVGLQDLFYGSIQNRRDKKRS